MTEMLNGKRISIRQCTLCWKCFDMNDAEWHVMPNYNLHPYADAEGRHLT